VLSNWHGSAPSPSLRSPLTSAISESCLRNWLARADIDEGPKEGLTTAGRDELVKLRRENRVLRMEKEILGNAGAFFATENCGAPELGPVLMAQARLRKGSTCHRRSLR
jgi:transposase-like protein